MYGILVQSEEALFIAVNSFKLEMSQLDQANDVEEMQFIEQINYDHY